MIMIKMFSKHQMCKLYQFLGNEPRKLYASSCLFQKSTFSVHLVENKSKFILHLSLQFSKWKSTETKFTTTTKGVGYNHRNQISQ